MGKQHEDFKYTLQDHIILDSQSCVNSHGLFLGTSQSWHLCLAWRTI